MLIFFYFFLLLIKLQNQPFESDQNIYRQMNGEGLDTISLILVSIQTGLYSILLGLSVFRLVTVTRDVDVLLRRLHLFSCSYIILELGLQIFQLISILSGYTAQENTNIVFAINIFCLLFDLSSMSILAMYWQKIQISLASQVTEASLNKFVRRTILLLIWLLIFLAYFIYLFVSSNLSMSQTTLDQANKIGLFLICPSLSEFALILVSVWQTSQWRKMAGAIDLVSKVMPNSMNKTRFKTMFWTTVAFNIMRTIFMVYISYVAYEGSSNILIILLNVFNLSALLPITFYMLGFKLDQIENGELIEKEKRTIKSQKSNKSSSAHETELSYRSQKNSQNANNDNPIIFQ